MALEHTQIRRAQSDGYTLSEWNENVQKLKRKSLDNSHNAKEDLITSGEEKNLMIKEDKRTEKMRKLLPGLLDDKHVPNENNLSRRSSDPVQKHLQFKERVLITVNDEDCSRRRGSSLSKIQEYQIMRRLSPTILEHLPLPKSRDLETGDKESFIDNLKDEEKNAAGRRLSASATDRKLSLQLLKTERRTSLSTVLNDTESSLPNLKNNKQLARRRASANDAILDKSLQCAVCFQQFKYLSNLKTHMEVIHKRSFGKEKDLSSVENSVLLSKRRLSAILQCDVCSQVFKYAGNLESHMVAHRK